MVCWYISWKTAHSPLRLHRRGGLEMPRVDGGDVYSASRVAMLKATRTLQLAEAGDR